MPQAADFIDGCLRDITKTHYTVTKGDWMFVMAGERRLDSLAGGEVATPFRLGRKVLWMT